MRLQRRGLLHGMAVLPISWSQLGQSGRTSVAVGNGQELAERLSRARPGDVITLEPGEYGGVDELAVTVDGVSLVSMVPLGAIIRAPLVVDGDGVLLADLAFRDPGAPGFQLAAVAACSDSLSIRGRDVEVKGCDFGYFGARAILVRPTGLRPHIHDCTFHDNRDGGGDHNAHEAISLGYVASCHDISDGGALTTAAEMCIGSGLGMAVSTQSQGDTALFAELSGRYLLEITKDRFQHATEFFAKQAVAFEPFGRVIADPKLVVSEQTQVVCDLPIEQMTAAWQGTLDW